MIDSLLKQMSLAEKIGQLNLINPGDQPLTGSVGNVDAYQKVIDGKVGMMFGTGSIEIRREIQTLCVSESRLKIPMLFASDVVHGYRTAFPLPIALSCAWDLDLIEKAAHLSATEARADGIDLTFAPMIDVSRDPRWGRVAEGFGESAELVSMMASAAVRGFQGDPSGQQLADSDRIAACAKHFAGYGAADGGRDYAGANFGPNELHETFLPPFLAAIEAGVASVMPGFNTIDRIPVTAHADLLTNLLRGQWNFDGLVISDYTAINELERHGLGDLRTVVALAINAGIDIDMVGEGFVSTLESSVRAGAVTEETINQACRRILSLKEKLGLFEDPFRSLDADRSKQVIGNPSIREEARRMASRSCVLLKNDNDVLPLSPSKTNGNPLKVALIGPLGNDRSNLAGTWSVSAKPEDNVTLLEGLLEHPSDKIDVRAVHGCNLTDDPELAKRLNVFGETVVIDPRSNEELIKEAVQTAIDCDVAVVTVGEAKEHSGESSSRTELDLPPLQLDLIRAVRATGRPVVLTVFAGRPLVLTDIVDLADAILYVWYGGSMMGPGVADVLTGKQEPSGCLTMAFPRSVGQIPVHHDQLPTGRPKPSDTDFVKFTSCYLDQVNEPLFPFGFGLTYTTFELSEPKLDHPVLSPDQDVTLTTTVTNTGERDGSAVVQLYLSDPVASLSRPGKWLNKFQRVSLAASESAEVTFNVTSSDFDYAIASTVSEFTRSHLASEKTIHVGMDSAELVSVPLKVEIGS